MTQWNMINFQTHDNGWRMERRRMKNWRDEFEFTTLGWLWMMMLLTTFLLLLTFIGMWNSSINERHRPGTEKVYRKCKQWNKLLKLLFSFLSSRWFLFWKHFTGNLGVYEVLWQSYFSVCKLGRFLWWWEKFSKSNFVQQWRTFVTVFLTSLKMTVSNVFISNKKLWRHAQNYFNPVGHLLPWKL